MKTVQPEIGYLIFLVLPIVIYYATKLNGKSILMFLVFVIPFLAGALELLGFSSVNTYSLITEIIIIFLFILALLKPSGRLTFIGGEYVLAFVLLSILSFALNEVSLLQTVLFLRIYLLPILFLWYLINKNFNNNQIDYYNGLVIALYLSQIPVALGKFLIIGTQERYMGTMSIFGGSLTTMFALIGMAIFMSLFLIRRKLTYFIAIIGFFLFAIIGEKRAILFFSPILIIYVAYYFNKKRSISLRLSSIPLAIIVVLLIVYSSVRLSPTLNPENRLGGSFDPKYVMDYTTKYLFPDRTVKGAYYYGRGEGPKAVLELLTSKDNFKHLFIGYGPGDLVTSQFINMENNEISRGEDLIAHKYDIGYGARTGILWTTLQTGVIGTLLIILFYRKLYRRVYRRYISSNNIDNALVLASLGLMSVWLIDFVTYSRTMLNNYPVVVPFIWFISLVIKGREGFFSQKNLHYDSNPVIKPNNLP